MSGSRYNPKQRAGWCAESISGREGAGFPKDLLSRAREIAKTLEEQGKYSDKDVIFWTLLEKTAWIRKNYPAEIPCTLTATGSESPMLDPNNPPRQTAILNIEKGMRDAFKQYPDQKVQDREAECLKLARKLITTLKEQKKEVDKDHQKNGLTIMGWNPFNSDLSVEINKVIKFAEEHYPEAIVATDTSGHRAAGPVSEAKASTPVAAERKSNAAAANTGRGRAATTAAFPAESADGRNRAGSEMVSVKNKGPGQSNP